MIPTVAREVGAEELLHESHLSKPVKTPSLRDVPGTAAVVGAAGDNKPAPRKFSLLSGTTAPLPNLQAAPARSRFEHLLPPSWQKSVMDWFHEDVPVFDYGGFVVGETEQVAILYGKTKGVLAGVPFFEEVFRQCKCRVEW